MKTWLYLPLLMLGLIFTSCKKEEVVIPNKTILQTVYTGDWKPIQGDPKSSFVEIAVQEIQTNTDGVIVSIANSGGNTFEMLPEVFGTTSYNVVHYPGVVRLEIATTNGTQVTPPGNITVKIVVIPSRQIQ